MDTSDSAGVASAVEHYFAENPDIFDVELTEENTIPRRWRR